MLFGQSRRGKRGKARIGLKQLSGDSGELGLIEAQLSSDDQEPRLRLYV